MSTLSNVETRRGEANPPSVRLAPDTIPEAKSSKTGVSVRYVPDNNKSWYVFRASYGREDKASDYIIEDGTFVYIAKRYIRKSINGKQKKVLETLIPNLLFVYTTEDKAKEYMKTPALSYLTYYYNHFVQDETGKNPPLDGAFNGVEGRVARVSGQQRVIVELTNVGLVSTAYIPTAFIQAGKK